jgi:hypothetical protein
MHVQDNIVFLNFKLNKFFVAHCKWVIGKNLPSQLCRIAYLNEKRLECDFEWWLYDNLFFLFLYVEVYRWW